MLMLADTAAFVNVEKTVVPVTVLAIVLETKADCCCSSGASQLLQGS